MVSSHTGTDWVPKMLSFLFLLYLFARRQGPFLFPFGSSYREFEYI